MNWTIGMVNYKTIDLISYHCRVFDSYCKDFEFLVWDNESDYLTDDFSDLMKKYSFLRVMPSPKRNSRSNSHGFGLNGIMHGFGLNGIMEKAVGKRIFFCDPDFFYMKKNVLNFFNRFFEDGYRSVGTEYWGETFPMPWGAAYILNDIKDLDLRSNFNYCEKCKKSTYEKMHDTGFQLRIRLGNYRFMSFKELLPHQLPNLGWKCKWPSQTFVHEEKIVAHHLKEGSQVQNLDSTELKNIKKNYCDWFWENLQD